MDQVQESRLDEAASPDKQPPMPIALDEHVELTCKCGEKFQSTKTFDWGHSRGGVCPKCGQGTVWTHPDSVDMVARWRKEHKVDVAPQAEAAEVNLAEDLDVKLKWLRKVLEEMKGHVVTICCHPYFAAGDERLSPQCLPTLRNANMRANLVLVFRSLEDARMRTGKALQAMQGGISILDKPPFNDGKAEPVAEAKQVSRGGDIDPPDAEPLKDVTAADNTE